MKKNYPHTKRTQSLNASAKSAGIRSGVGVYFDYAAATPMDPRVVKAMIPYYSGIFGNPGSLHKFGQEASAVFFKARNKISKLINCDYREIIFTGSATEANNLAIRGIIKNFYDQRLSLRVLPKPCLPAGRNLFHNEIDTLRPSEVFDEGGSQTPRNDNSLIKPRIITSQIEHESILETCRDIERDGLAEVIYLPVSKTGIVDLKKLKESLNERTVLVSIMYANNEVGSIQPIKEISEIIREFNIKNIKRSNSCHSALDAESRKEDWIPAFAGMTENNSLFPLLHTDAAQAFNYLDCDVKDLGVDLLTFSSQKIYGPKGVGLLYVKRGMWNETKNMLGSSMVHSPYPISPIITGGGQEEGLRSGTENIAGVVGMAEAAQIAFDLRKKESQRLYKLQNYFIGQVKKISPKVVLNGPAIGKQRLPNNINIYFSPNPAAGRASRQKDLIFKLDFAGFAVSGGSACSARLAKPSHVLKAMGCSDVKASESIRISFGRQTTKQAIDRLLKVLYRMVSKQDFKNLVR